MDKEKVNKSKIIKTITIYMLLFLIMVLGIVFYSKFLPKNSFSADNEMIKLQANLEKYINYKTSENDKGTLVQFNVKTSIECKSQDTKYIPPKQTQIKLEMSQIDGKYPHGIKLIPISTEATNGKTKDIKEDYRYDPETGNLIINTSNLDENNELMCAEKKANAKDEYTVICYYDTYIEQAAEREIAIKATAIGVLSEDDSLINFQEEFKGKVKDNVGELVSVENVTPEIYNGNIKSNIINKTEYATKYNETQKISVSKKDAQERIYIVENNEFSKIEKTQSGEQVETDLENNNELIYKTTTINKEDIIKILGEDGKIEILNNDQEVLASIDKNTEFDENGNVTINYLNDTKSIIIKTSKIQNEGILKLENTKEIKSTMTNAVDTRIKTTVKLFDLKDEIKEKNEETNNKIIEKNKDTAEQTVVQKNKNENTINNIKDATTSNEVTTNETDSKNKEKIEEIKQILVLKSEKNNTIELKNSTTNIDFRINNTNWTNKEQNEVVFDIDLNSNDLKDNLFNNPKLGIELPKEVEKVILGDSHLVYGNGLELKDVQLQKNNEDKFVIIANIEGNQTTYNNNSLELKTNIQIPAIIILKKDIESITDKINFVYENSYTLDGSKEVANFGYDIQIENYKEEKVENIKEENAENINNKNIENTKEETNKTEDRNKARNRNIEIIKSEEPKRIEGLDLEVTPVKGNTVIKENDIIYEGEFIKYNIKVTNNSDKEINNLKIVGTIPEGTIYGELEADYHNYMGKYEYNYNDQITYKEISVNKLNINESYSIFYEVRVKDLEDNILEQELTSNIKMYVSNELTNNYELKNTIKKAEAKVFLGAFLDNNIDRWNYSLKVESENNEQVQVKIVVPEEFELELRVEAGGQEGTPVQLRKDNNNIVTDTIETNKEYWYEGVIKNSDIREKTDESKMIFKAIASVEIGGKSYVSNENRIDYELKSVSITMSSENEGEEVNCEEEINYDIKVKNTGRTNLNINDEIDIIAIDVKDYLPDEVKPISMEYEYWEKVEEKIGETVEVKWEKKKESKKIQALKDREGNKLPSVDLTLNIPYNEEINIKVKTIAGEVSEKTKIENSATIMGDEINSKTSNIVSHIILPFKQKDDDDDKPVQPDKPIQPVNPGDDVDGDGEDKKTDPGKENNIKEKYTISGIAWLDENKDGQRQNNEKKLGGIRVILVNSESSKIVSNNIRTDDNGEYKITDLDKGKYIVLFQYDTQNYNVTEYKKSGVSAEINSDVSNTEITLNGNRITVGATDQIDLETTVKNIDIGLIKNGICDLKLDKYISSVSVNTPKSTKQYSYNDEKLAKIEIKPKEIDNANVVIEYNIVITNEGEIPAKVGEVIDYIPEGLEFSSELNKDWGTQTKGQLINTSLSNTNINPGESASLSLKLTKSMNSESTGQYINSAEIGSISNYLGTNDNDSTPRNKNKAEDDYSEATLIISISTGGIILIGIISLITMSLIIAFIVLLKKGVFKNKKITKIIKLTMFMIIFSATLLTCKDSVFSYNFIANNPEYFWYIDGPYYNYYGSTSFWSDNYGYAICQNAGLAAHKGYYYYSGVSGLVNSGGRTSENSDITLTKASYSNRSIYKIKCR